MLKPAYLLSGTITPDSTGFFYYRGEYAGKHYWATMHDEYFLWYYSPSSFAYITAELGNTVQPRHVGGWFPFDEFPDLGNYIPEAGATGTGVLTAY